MDCMFFHFPPQNGWVSFKNKTLRPWFGEGGLRYVVQKITDPWLVFISWTTYLRWFGGNKTEETKVKLASAYMLGLYHFAWDLGVDLWSSNWGTGITAGAGNMREGNRHGSCAVHSGSAKLPVHSDMLALPRSLSLFHVCLDKCSPCLLPWHFVCWHTNLGCFFFGGGVGSGA